LAMPVFLALTCRFSRSMCVLCRCFDVGWCFKTGVDT
jgi:hypothetical protein